MNSLISNRLLKDRRKEETMKKIILIAGVIFITKKIIDHANERKSINIDSNLLGATIYGTLQADLK